MFNSLLIDEDDAMLILDKLKLEQRADLLCERLEAFWKYGYCIIPDAVPIATIDIYMQQFYKTLRDGKFKASYGLNIMPAEDADLERPLTKILDTYVYCQAGREIAFASPIKTFLETLFGESALAFQGLHFELGSTQAVHQDTAYVVGDEPKSLAAVWTALEDVEPGSGELVYYPGSHRFSDFLYPGDRKNWSPDDGAAIDNHHLFWLHEEARRQGLTHGELPSEKR
jgi:phytanoyl-CoA hydroxylase